MKKTTCTFLSLAALVAGLFFYTACETSSTNDSRGVSVSPASASLGAGQSIVLTASGGWDYTWEVEVPDLGYLSSAGGSQATYTAKGGHGTQRITVRAKGSTTSSSSTNTPTTTTTSFATAHIYQGF